MVHRGPPPFTKPTRFQLGGGQLVSTCTALPRQVGGGQEEHHLGAFGEPVHLNQQLGLHAAAGLVVAAQVEFETKL